MGRRLAGSVIHVDEDFAAKPKGDQVIYNWGTVAETSKTKEVR